MDVSLPGILTFELSLRLYHWTTSSFAHHKATDELANYIHSWIDSFVESWSGSTTRELGPVAQRPQITMDVPLWTEDSATRHIQDMRDRAMAWHIPDQALSSLRDDLVAALEKTIYLTRLS
jgi:hypothetical protein